MLKKYKKPNYTTWLTWRVDRGLERLGEVDEGLLELVSVRADGGRGHCGGERRRQAERRRALRRRPEDAQIVPARLAAGAAAAAAVVAAHSLRRTRLRLELCGHHFGRTVARLESHHARRHHDETWQEKHTEKRYWISFFVAAY